MPEPCTPTPDYAIFLYGARTWLLVLHALSSVVLLGASTHHALLMRHFLRGRFLYKRLARVYAKVIAVAYAVCFGIGALAYPSYRYHVRGLYLDRYAPWAAGLFDMKEMFASLALLVAIGLGLLALTFDPEEEPHLAPVYGAMSLLVCAVVWFNVVAGLVVVSVRGAG